ncbi:Hypothetical protein FKW44_001591 [Caligus rogercresseyi]|uniref:Uncharacterized protein n=1 Tax=Caligus rogercresseyi TaxID=217165 RepID=A0A7T8KJ07_CALRO|nr:Hypothetical protein FKW44_001591 [Caligus rogercresseyi]
MAPPNPSRTRTRLDYTDEPKSPPRGLGTASGGPDSTSLAASFGFRELVRDEHAEEVSEP